MKHIFYVFSRVCLFIAVIFSSSIIFSEELPQRIISLAPANTEILYALNLGDKIVGVTSYCNYPPQATQKEKIGDFSNPNVEKIVSLKPDLILATGLEQNPAVKKLKNLGLNIVVIDPQNFNQMFDDISRVGALTGTKTYAFLLNESLKNRIGNVMKKIAETDSTHPKLFIEISTRPLMTAAQNTFLDEMVNMLRAINIAHNLPRPYCRVSEEFVIKQNPDFLILTSPNAKIFFEGNPLWAKVTAVERKRIITDIHPDLLMRPGPRLIDGLEQLAEKIYGIKIH